ncbi:MAG: hypothetical protein D6775_15250 [Caldilineae bacterium]|nr:MAG: hypothetical protein D6775_15250 [Caldilineae bacterium]
MLSRRAWFTLIGLALLSLLVASAAIFLVQRAAPFPLGHPAFGTPWEPRVPWERHHGAFPWQEGHRFPDADRPIFSQASPWWVLGRVLASEVFFFIIGALVVALMPRRMQALLAALQARERSTGLLGIGFLSGVLFVALAVLAAFSLIGLPFLPLLLILFALAWGVGLVAAAIRLGQWVGTLTRIPDRHILLDLALGVLAFFTLGSIPLLGVLTLFLAGLWGLGTVIATRMGDPSGWQLTWPEETPSTDDIA